MAKNDFNLSFVAAFKQSFNGGESISGTGSLRFTLPDKKTVGTVALRGGKIEALEITRHPNYILQRLAHNELVSDTNRDMLLGKFRNNADSPLVADFVRQYMMLPEQVITDAVKEHFLGVLDEMITWNAVRVDYKPGAEDRVLTMPLVSPDKLIDLGQRRAQLLQKIADECTIEPSQLDDLIFKKLEDVVSDDEDVQMILRYGSGEFTPADLYRQCGIITFNSIRELHQLWRDRVVDLIYAGQFPLSRPEELDQDVIDATAAEAAAEAAVDDQQAASVQTAAEEAKVEDAPATTTEPDSEPQIDAMDEVEETDAEEVIVPADEPTRSAAVAPPRQPTQLMSPFDDDDEIFAADEFDDTASTAEVQPQAAVEPTPAIDAVPAAPSQVEPAQNGNVAAGVQDFLRAVQNLKDEAQASWDEVAARDEEIEKVRVIIQEQQEYLDRLVEERAAWNDDFEAKRTDYEQTVAYLREHLN